MDTAELGSDAPVVWHNLEMFQYAVPDPCDAYQFPHRVSPISLVNRVPRIPTIQ